MSRRQPATKRPRRGPLPALLVVLLLAGCADLDRHVDRCHAFGGKRSYTRAGDAVQFVCR